MRYGRFWKLEWALDSWVSVGVHIDFRSRLTGRTKQRYGPYVDLHLGVVIVSLGVNPVYSGEYDLLAGPGRGGRPAEES